MELESERLILRPIEERDGALLFPLINDPKVAAGMLALPHPFPEDQIIPMIRRIRDRMCRRERYELVMVLKETGEVIGMCRLRDVCWDHMHAQITYWLGQKYWGNGYMLEAVGRMLEFCFDELKFERVDAACLTTNVASIRVLEKSGFRYEGCSRRKYKKDGRYVDMLYYGIVREDREL